MNARNKLSRYAGAIYLGVVITGLFSLMYVPDQLIDYDSPSNTFNSIQNSELLFRWGIIGGLLCYGFFLALPILLYKLLGSVNETAARLMLLLALMSVPMYFINVQNLLTALSLVNDPSQFAGFTSEQIHQQVMLCINHYDQGMRLIHVFSGLWLFPLGYLVYQSGFLPKVLGILLMLGCFGYLINFFGRLAYAEYGQLGIGSYISLPASFGEIGTCLWLLLVGAREKSFTKKAN